MQQDVSMIQKTTTVPGAAVRGIAWGTLVMAFFGTLWASVGIGGLQGWGLPWLVIIAVLAGVALLLGGISLMRAARRFPQHIAETDRRHWRRIGIWFGIIFTLEGVTIGIASVICNAFNDFNVFFPVMAIIVGVHFFPLARLFKVKAHYVTGALLCVLSILTLFVVPPIATIHGQQIIAWWVVVGWGSALILWITGLRLWLMGQTLVSIVVEEV